MSLASPPEGWVVWNDEPVRVILAYRPDVFDGGDLPTPCMPTIDVSRGLRDRRPGRQRLGDEWHVTLYLEPEVDAGRSSYPDRTRAIEAAMDRAAAFARGGVDYRERYQVPRPEYVERLDELTGRTD
jgi:hypothetical protein